VEWGEVPGQGRIGIGAGPGQFSGWDADQQRGGQGTLHPDLLAALWPRAQQPGPSQAVPGLESSPGVGNGHAQNETNAIL
jgi:hypothetical protein